MGIQSRQASSGLADSLFSQVQQRVLGLLFGQPDRRFQGAELIRLAQGGSGATHRQLTRLASAGLVTVSRVGNQRYYQANQASAVFADLHNLIIKTVGIVEPLRESLETLVESIQAAFVFGSVAKGSDRATSDIDLMVITSETGYPDLHDGLQRAEQVLARKVNPLVMTLEDWRKKRGTPDSFAAKVASGPKLFVYGGESDIA